MNKIIVYKLNRQDGLSYIGVTTNFKKRLNCHKIHNRFVDCPISSYEILGEFISYDEALNFETKMITEHDTFHSGLNKTYSGKGNHHNSKKFTTKGFKFTEESKKKMSLSAKRRGIQSLMQYYNKLTPEDLQTKYRNHSQKTKGIAKPTRLKKSIVIGILKAYKQRPDLKGVGSVQRNGKKLTYEQAFAKLYSNLYQVNIRQIRLIITGQVLSWKPLYEKIVLSKY